MAMGPVAEVFVKFAHAQKVAAINICFSAIKKKALSIFIKIVLRMPFKVF